MSLPTDLLVRAKQPDVNISRASERGLRAEVHEAEARVWAAQHADFIAELNARIEHDGLPLDEYRMFWRPVLICTTTRLPGGERSRHISSMCKATGLGSLLPRVVIPLTRLAGNYTCKVAQDLAPIIEIGGEKFILETPFLGAMRTSELGPRTGTLKFEQSRVLAALNRLFGATD